MLSLQMGGNLLKNLKGVKINLEIVQKLAQFANIFAHTIFKSLANLVVSD